MSTAGAMHRKAVKRWTHFSGIGCALIEKWILQADLKWVPLIRGTGANHLADFSSPLQILQVTCL